MQPVTLPPGLQSDAMDASAGSPRAHASTRIDQQPAPGSASTPSGAVPSRAHADGHKTAPHDAASSPGHAAGHHAAGRHAAGHHAAGHHASERRMASFADFALIREPGVEVAHWHRPQAAHPDLPLPPDERQWKGKAAEALADPLLPLAVLPDAASRSRLQADIHDLTAAFLAIARGLRVEANLSVVHGVQCPKWHVDHVAFRLTCTFRGPGTEWVCGAEADRTQLGRPLACLMTANRLVVPEGVHVHRAAPGDVVLLKGRVHAPDDAGAIHRSPEVDAATGPRLVWALTAWPA